MENQHRKIKGYRELNEEEIALMNEVKEQAVALHALHDKITRYLILQSNNAPTIQDPLRDEFGEVRACNVERLRLAAAEPGRWASIAKTHFQEGTMALTRAIAQPGFF